MAMPFKRSVVLRTAPSHRQARVIIGRLEQALKERGAVVETRGSDALNFRMPYLWRASRFTWLLAASAGAALVSGAGGGPWRVRYSLRFVRLRIMCIAASALLVFVGLDWPRLALLNALVILWLGGYALIAGIATASLWRLVRAASAEVAERRHTPRDTEGVQQPPP